MNRHHIPRPRLVELALLTLTALLGLTASAHAEAVCWKDTYGRGVGEVPPHCAHGQQRIGALCYDRCRSGWQSRGFACEEPCRAGYNDDGLTCHRPLRIVGADTSQCPWWDACGLTFARGCSRCPAGYINDGCTCRRPPHIYGQPRYERAPHIANRCDAGDEMDAGLCYPRCRSGFYGVGPVCWSECPDHAGVDCGALCGSSGGVCAEVIANMVLAPVELVANVAGLVGTGGASAAARAAGRAAAEGLATEVARQAARDQVEQMIRETAAAEGRRLSDAEVAELAAAVVGASADGAFDWSALDPIGILAVIDAFDQPLCGQEPDNRIVCDGERCTDADGRPIVSGWLEVDAPHAGMVLHATADGDGYDEIGQTPGQVFPGNRFVEGVDGLALDMAGNRESGVLYENSGRRFDLTAAWTLSAWVRPARSGSDWRADPIIWKIGTRGQNDDTFAFGWDRGDRFRAGLERASDGRDYTVYGRQQTVGDWALATATYDGDHLRIYVDGVLDGCNRIGRHTAYTGPDKLRIGSLRDSNHGNRGHFDGQIDDARIYDRALSPDEVVDLYVHHVGAPPVGTPIVCP